MYQPLFHIQRFVLSILLLSTLFLSEAGAGSFNPDNLRARHLTITEGLTSNMVFSIVQDQQGFIWIGTINGINKYDGKTITQFQHNSSDSTSLAVNNGGNLFCDSRNQIWVGTWGAGVDLLDPLTGRFRHFPPDKNNPEAIGDDKIQSIFEDSKGTLWFCTMTGGLSRLDSAEQKTGKFINYRPDPDNTASISHVRTRNVAEDKAGNLWIGTDNGFCRLRPEDRDSGKFTRFQLPVQGEKYVYRVMTDQAGNLWLGAMQGLFLLKEPQTIGEKLPAGRLVRYTFDRQQENLPVPNHAYVLLEDDEQKIWVGSSYGGFLRFDPQSADYARFRPEASVSSEAAGISVRAFCQDKSRNLWVGDINNGVTILDLKPPKFSQIHYKQAGLTVMNSPDVLGLYPGDRDDFWIGSLHGLSRMSKTADGRFLFDYNYLRGLTGSTHVELIRPAGPNELWVSVVDMGLLRLNTKSRTWRHYQARAEIADSLSSNKIDGITVNSDGSLWLATGNGLNLFEPDKNRFRRFMANPADSTALPNPILFQTAYDWKNRLWVAGAAGFSVSTMPVTSPRKTDHLSFRNYHYKPGVKDALVNNQIYHFHASQLNGRPVMWLGTVGGLSAVTEDEQGRLHFENYTTEQGLPHNLVNGIQEDGRGRLWLSTFNGLSCFDPQNRVFRNYNTDDGLQGRYFSSNGSFRLADGSMIFAGSNGINFFHPDSVKENPYPPQLAFTFFAISDHSVQQTGFIPSGTEFRLSHTQNNFTVEFAALEFTDPGQNQYACRLDGFDQDWVHSGNNGSASYMNLRPGRYTLRVKGSNNDGLWTENEIYLSIEIIPPLWERAWFRLLALLFIGGSIWAVHQFRLRGIRRHNRELRREIEERKKAETLLSQSEEKYRNLIENSFDIYFSMNPKGIFTGCNEAFLREGDYQREKVIGQDFRTLVFPEDMDVAMRAFQEGLTGKISRFEMRAVIGDGSFKWFSFVNYPVIRADGRVAEIQGHARNISERKQIEAQLIESEQRFRNLYDFNPSMYFTIDSAGTVISVNHYGAEHLGYKREELIGQPVLKVFYPEDHGTVTGQLNHCLEHPDEFSQWEIRKVTKQGELIWVREMARLIRQKSGEPLLLVACDDITDRVQDELSLQNYIGFLEVLKKVDQIILRADSVEKMLEDVLEAMIDIFECDRAWLLFPCDPQAEAWFVPMEKTRAGYSGVFSVGLSIPMDDSARNILQSALDSAEAIVSRLADLKKIRGEDEASRFGVQSQIHRAIYPKTGQPWLFGLQQCSHDREWSELDQQLFTEIGGRISDALSSLLLFRELQASRERHELALQGADLAMWDKNLQTGAVTYNLRWSEMLGFTPDEVNLPENKWENLVHPDDMPAIKKLFDRHLAGEIPVYAIEYRMRAKDGRWKWILDRGKVLEWDKTGQPLRAAGTHLDITERKQAEALLLEERDFSDQLLSGLPGLIYLFDDQGRFRRWNKNTETVTGSSPEEISRKTALDLIADESKEDVARAIGQVFSIGQGFVEGNVLAAGGQKIPYLLTGWLVTLNNQRYLLGTGVDISERKLAETEKQETMERRQREADAVAALKASPGLARGQVELLAAELTERAAEVLKTGRVGVWLFNEDETVLQNIDNYLSDTGLHSSGAVLREDEFKNKFVALKTEKYVDAHDPLTDPRTSGYVQDYLLPNHITSMLDAVIRLGGRNLGTLCFEHVNTPHHWTEDEISFACQCADQIALAIANRERLKADEKTLEMAEFNRSIISSAPVGILSISTRGEIISTNEAFLEMMGSPGLEVTQKLGMSLPAVESAGITKAFKNTLSTGQPFEMHNLPYASHWGRQLVVNLKGVPQKNREGEIIGLLMVIENITESLHHKKALLQSESKFTAIAQSAGDAIISSDPEGRMIVWNKGAEAIFGYTEQEALGQPLLLIIPEKYQSVHPGGLQKLHGNDGMNFPGRTMEIEGRHRDGRLFPAEISLAAWEQEGERYFSAIIRDITKRKETERQLIRHEDQQRVVNELLHLTLGTQSLPEKLDEALKIILSTQLLTVLQRGGIFLADDHHLNLTASINMSDDLCRKCSRISFGQCLCGQVAERREILFSKCEESHCAALYQEAEAYGHYNVPILSQDQVLGVLVLYLGPDFSQAEGEFEFMGTIANTLAAIIEQSQTQTEIQKLAAVVEQSSESVVLTNTDGEIEYCNPAFTRNTGYAADEVLSRKTNILRSGKHEDEFYHDLWSNITEGQTWVGRFVNRRRDGSEFTEDAVIFPIKNNSGQIVNFCKISRDVSHELQLIQQLQQAQKMEAIGTLAGGVAHDFNNLLTVINGYADMALIKMKENDPFHPHMSSILLAGRKAGNLTRQLLAFSRKQIYKPESMDLNHVISSMEKLLRRLISEDIRMDTLLADRLPRIKADTAQIEQILTNLVVNARDAVQAIEQPGFKKRITIETGVSVLDTSYTQTHLGSQPGEMIFLSISDNGIGMDEQTKERIFEPFFTTKAKDKGTGLGLAMVYGIVKQNQGSIYVYSEPGQGTTFKIFWPVTREAGQVGEDTTVREVFYGDETILLVEDDAEVRKFAVTSLQTLGYTVHQAGNGESALSLISNERLQIDLLITDLIMPEMNGRELAERILAAFPGTGILYASGYTDNHIVEGGALEAGVNFLQKPYSQQTLAAEVRRVLDKRERERKGKA